MPSNKNKLPGFGKSLGILYGLSIFGQKKQTHGSRHRSAQMKFFGGKWKGGKAKI